jgi:hypothetical protein
VLVLAQRIEPLLCGQGHLALARDDLLANRAVRVVAVDEVEKIRRDRERQFLVREQAARPLLGRERHVALELLDGREPVLELPRPILPVGCRDVLPKSLALKPGGAVFLVRHERVSRDS